ncbi:transcription factor TGA4 isoform X2 [Primulina huaijiensis]|uniref:transcription factor TGA4 isoform X2 n=1 Tax=Primulina huaijiensis TaxID=1492673 RepID=UPI003CC71631
MEDGLCITAVGFLPFVFLFLIEFKLTHSRNKMNSTSTHFVPSRRMDIYEPIHQMTMWGDFKENNCEDLSPPMILEIEGKLDNQSEETSHGTVGPSSNDQEASRRPDKVQRRLAQNREAARKSRLRKKAYVQQLESSKLKLIQLEQELGRARQQGLCAGGGLDTSQLGYSETINPGITAFEMEYGHWVEEQNIQISDLRNALQSNVGDMELSILIERVLKHYADLFAMKATAARIDVFYLMSGMWKTSAERFFLWIGGFRPSELLKVLLPHLEPMSEQQHFEVCNLRQNCQQAEDAFSQGMEKLRYIVAEAVGAGRLGEGNYLPQITAAIEKLEALVRFVGQADHLRQETLQQISRILEPPQAARGLLALGEYLQRLRALSSLWSSRPCEPT